MMRTSVLFVALAALVSVAVTLGDNEAGIALGGEVEAITDGTGAFSALSKLADGEKPTAAAPKMVTSALVWHPCEGTLAFS